MKTFGQFLGDKIVDHKINECARLMVEAKIEPEDFVKDYFDSLEMGFTEGFWNNLLQGAKRWGSAAKQVAGSVLDGGLKYGTKQAMDTVAGPKVKFKKAVQILQDVSKFLQDEPKTSGMASRVDPQMTIAKHLDKMIDTITKEVMPALDAPKVTQDYGREQEPEQEPDAQAPNAQAPNAQASGTQASGTQAQAPNDESRNRLAKDIAARRSSPGFQRSPSTSPRRLDKSQQTLATRYGSGSEVRENRSV